MFKFYKKPMVYGLLLASVPTLIFSSDLDKKELSSSVLKNENSEIIQINYESLKKDSWSDKEVENAKLMVDFVQHLMNNHDFDYVKKNFGNNLYVQHSKGIADGMDALIEYVADFAKRYPEYTYDVKHIYVDGDYVIFHSHATANAKDRGNDQQGLNIIDTWKIKNGQIVEHWDSIQAINGSMRFFMWVAGGKTENNNGLF